MTEREKFEAAWRKEYPLHGTTTFMRSALRPDAYVNTRVQDGWLMWQASRRAALEEGPCRGYVRGLSNRCWNDGMLILDAEDWCTINNILNGTHTETDPTSP